MDPQRTAQLDTQAEPRPNADVADAVHVDQVLVAEPVEQSLVEQSLVEQSLVDEVSIDGMCGVY
jgi:mycofactocin precursor